MPKYPVRIPVRALYAKGCVLLSMLRNMRKSKSLNFSFSILALFLSGNCNAQSNVLEIYQNKLLEIDTTRYFNIELSRSKHIIGGKTDFIYISASQIHLGEKISTFIDSTKKFY